MQKKAFIWTLIGLVLVAGLIAAMLIFSGKEKPKDALKDVVNQGSTSTSQKVPDKLKDGTYFGTADGYEGPVKVKVVVKDGKISGVEVVEHTETPEYFEIAKPILKKIVEKNTYNVDSISGATITSDAIKVAVYKALLGAGMKTTDDVKKLEEKTKELAEKEKAKENVEGVVVQRTDFTPNSTSQQGLKDGTYYGSSRGYNGQVRVAVTVRGGKITDIRVVEHNEDMPYYNKARSVISKILNGEKVDTVSGSTVTSAAIINAVSDALNKATYNVTPSNKDGGRTISVKPVNPINPVPVPPVTPPAPPAPPVDPGKQDFKNLKDGTYNGSSDGYYSNSIEVRVTVKEGKITGIDLVKNNDDKLYFDEEKARKLANDIISKQSTGVDTISGATISSKGYLRAVLNALSTAVGPEAKDSDKFFEQPKKILTFVGEAVTESSVKNSFDRLTEGVTVEIVNAGDISKVGETSIEVKLTFKDNSTKMFNIPVQVMKKASGEFKVLTKDEILELDKNKTYQDGEFYGDSFGYCEIKPIPVKVTIKGGKITAIDLVVSEIKRVVGRPGQADQVDVGTEYVKAYYKAKENILTHQNPMEMGYKFRIIREIYNKVLDYANGRELTAEVVNAAFDKILGKHEFGPDGKFKITDGSINPATAKEIICDTIKNYLKEELGYGKEDYDAVSGATYTGAGSAMAIENAVKKAEASSEISNFTIDDSKMKRAYSSNEKLDLSKLEASLTFKNGKGVVKVTYSEFEKYNIKVFNHKTRKEVNNQMALTKENIGSELSDGLYLTVNHIPTDTAKFVNTVTISKYIKYVAKEMKVRAVGTSEWLDLKGFKSTEFVQKLKISKTDAAKLMGKKIEFKIVANDGSESDTDFILESSSRSNNDNSTVFEDNAEKRYPFKLRMTDKNKLSFSDYFIKIEIEK